jgi:hypothetical protein
MKMPMHINPHNISRKMNSASTCPEIVEARVGQSGKVFENIG